MDRRLKKGLAIAIPVLLVTVGLILFFVLGDNKMPSITLSAYNQLSKGMTLEETLEIIGEKGNLQSSEGKKGADDYIATYIWYGKSDGSYAVITFNGELLASKTYIGLTD